MTNTHDELPPVTVVVLNWNAWEDTIGCVESVLTSNYPNADVLIIDNGSKDGSAAKLRAHFETHQRVRIHALPENLGFAGGCNAGIQIALSGFAEYVFLLNNDALSRADTLRALVATADEAASGIAGATVDEGAGGIFLGREWPAHLFGLGRLPSIQNPPRFWDSGFASGSAFLIRRDLLVRRIAEAGYVFDPRYFMYCEEVDLCRYALTRGYRCVISRDAVISHQPARISGGQHNARSYYYLSRNRIALANRWLRGTWRFAFHVYYLPSRLAIILLRLLRGQTEAARAILEGLADGYAGAEGKWARHDTALRNQAHEPCPGN